MAKNELNIEFLEMHRRIALGERALVAIAAHVEVRSVLRESAELVAHGLDDVLIGSYARRVSIWPGRDVDVLGRLLDETIHSLGPDAAYRLFERALAWFAAEGRLTLQPRSLKVDYRPGRTPGAEFVRAAASQYGWERDRVDAVIRNLPQLAFEFSVDVVPAVRWDEHYGIPEVARLPQSDTRYRTGHWRLTSPVQLTERTQARNRSPRIGGKGAYVRTVREIKQIKTEHLSGAKPNSLYYEFVLHEGFASGAITGASWADITASALSYIAGRLQTAESDPVCDPVLGEPYQPAPSAADLNAARAVFEGQAGRARRAVAESRCQAALEWRTVMGGNAAYDKVFPVPDGCRGTGELMGGAAAANLASGGTRERSFGDR